MTGVAVAVKRAGDRPPYTFRAILLPIEYNAVQATATYTRATMSGKQIKTTLHPPLTQEFNLLCDHLGLHPAATLKLAVKRLIQSELKLSSPP